MKIQGFEREKVLLTTVFHRSSVCVETQCYVHESHVLEFTFGPVIVLKVNVGYFLAAMMFAVCCALYSVTLCFLQCAVCSVQCALCSVLCAVCFVQCAVCTV